MKVAHSGYIGQNWLVIVKNVFDVKEYVWFSGITALIPKAWCKALARRRVILIEEGMRTKTFTVQIVHPTQS